MTVYIGLFLTAFLAATVFPAQSEAVLAGLIYTGAYSTWMLILIASIGNVLGSAVNWALGLGIEYFRHRRWFPVKETTLQKAQAWYAQYGRWSLLLSWVPIIGDAITVAAGVMRERFLVFVALVAIAKTARYIFVAYFAVQYFYTLAGAYYNIL